MDHKTHHIIIKHIIWITNHLEIAHRTPTDEAPKTYIYDVYDVFVIFMMFMMLFMIHYDIYDPLWCVLWSIYIHSCPKASASHLQVDSHQYKSLTFSKTCALHRYEYSFVWDLQCNRVQIVLFHVIDQLEDVVSTQ